MNLPRVSTRAPGDGERTQSPPPRGDGPAVSGCSGPACLPPGGRVQLKYQKPWSCPSHRGRVPFSLLQPPINYLITTTFSQRAAWTRCRGHWKRPPSRAQNCTGDMAGGGGCARLSLREHVLEHLQILVSVQQGLQSPLRTRVRGVSVQLGFRGRACTPPAEQPRGHTLTLTRSGGQTRTHRHTLTCCPSVSALSPQPRPHAPLGRGHVLLAQGHRVLAWPPRSEGLWGPPRAA